MIIKENIQEPVRSASDVANIIRAILDARGEEDMHKEMMYSIGLNSQNRIIYIDLVSIGTVNMCHPPLREMFRLALIKDAVSIIAAHNHPSEDAKPSPQDINFTHEMTKAGKILSISVLDHVIVAGEGYTSFSEEGII